MIASQRPYGLRLIRPTPVKIKANLVAPRYGGFAEFWSTWDWTGWIKPQIDLAVSLGANCIKIGVGGGPSQYEGGGTSGTAYPDSATYHAHVQQLNSYCRALGIGVYAVMGGPYSLSTANYAAKLAAAAVVGGWLEEGPCIGLDIANEINFSDWSDPTTLATGLGNIRAAMRLQTSLPLSASVYLQTPGDWTGYWMQAAAPFCDFHDGHPYYGLGGGGTSYTTVPAMSDLNGLVAASWYRGGIFFSEAGTNNGCTDSLINTYLAGVENLKSHPQCFGGAFFCVGSYGTDTPSTFGIVDQNLANSRASKANGFQAWTGRLN